MLHRIYYLLRLTIAVVGFIQLFSFSAFSQGTLPPISKFSLLRDVTGWPASAQWNFTGIADGQTMCWSVADNKMVPCSGGGGGSPGGSNLQIQFNHNGAFGGDPRLTWVFDDGQLIVGLPDGAVNFVVSDEIFSYNRGINSFLIDEEGIHFEQFDLFFGSGSTFTISATDITGATGLVHDSHNEWVFSKGPYLYDSNGGDSIYTDEKQLYDGENLSLDYGARQLLGPDGTTVMLDWSNPITTASIADSADKRYVTDAQQTVIGNTSGTNTGDQTSVSGNAGTATKWQTARNLAGNSVDGSANVAFANKFIVQGTSDAGLSAAQFLGSLGTGIVKNTTSTGVLSISNVTDDAQTKAAIVPNTAPAAGQILVGNAGGTAYAPATVSGSGATITMSSAGVATIATASDSVPGVMSAADHTILTKLSTATATTVAPAFVCAGCPVTSFTSGVDFKTNATTDLFTVPTSREFVVTNAMIIPRAVTSGAGVNIVWKIIESGASGVMTSARALSGAQSPTIGRYYTQSSALAGDGTYIACAAGNKVQFSITTAWTTSTAVTGDVFVFGFYSQ